MKEELPDREEDKNITIAYSSLMARCPRCGKGRIYNTFFDVSDNCAVCGLSLKEHEQGDGPAFFCICIIGSLVGILAAVIEIMFQPPFWLHAAIWIPLIIISSILGIRATKSALIALQYRYRPEDFT